MPIGGSDTDRKGGKVARKLNKVITIILYTGQ